MRRIHGIRKAVLMTGLGILLTLGTAASALAQATDVICSGCVDDKDIADLGVTVSDIADNAVTSAKIMNGTIANADVSATAAIAGTKIAPNFGSKNVVTLGKVGIGTTAPASPLDIQLSASPGNIMYLRGPAGQGAWLQYSPKNTGAEDWQAGANDGGYGIYNVNDNDYRLSIDNNGNVGIGTRTPGAVLHLQKTSGTTKLMVDNVGSGGQSEIYMNSNTSPWILFTQDNYRNGNLIINTSENFSASIMEITRAGNVGVGTTGPQDKLDVEGGSIVVNRTMGHSASGLYLSSAISPTHYNWMITAQDRVSGALEFGPSTAPGVTTWAEPVMVINQSGNVGIGTRTPAAKLNVEGPYPQLILNNPSSGAGDQILFRNAGIAAGFIGHQNSAAKLQFSSKDASVAHMTIDDNGNVGVGTTGPQDKLDVEGGSIVVNRYAGHSASGLYLSSTIGPTHYNWMITAQDRVSDALEFGSSTAPGVTTWAEPVMVIHRRGSVSIGVRDPGAYKLAVKGKIRAEEVVVDTGWADFVFDKNYKLMPLEKVAKHIEEAGHLPGIPTEKEVQENGISIGQIQSKLLQKIEEMTLYVIDLKKEDDLLRKENETLKERISALENKPM